MRRERHGKILLPLRPQDGLWHSGRQDGRLNITDVVLLLKALFGLPAALPCAGESISAGGNRTLHDVDSSGTVNLTDAIFILNHMFRRGPAPVLGTDCVTIPGCPDACAGP